MGKRYHFKGLVDTGNQLYDPISKMPVMFVSINKIVDDTTNRTKKNCF